MAIELVTGHAGSAHVSSEDIGIYQSLTAGTGRYVLGDAPTLTMTDANTLSISPCSLLVDGRYVRLTGTNTLTINSGAQTGQRIDIIYVRYAQASDGTESAALGVKTGDTATTATAPTLDYTGSILDGDQNVDIEIARVTLDALTPTASWTLGALDSLSGLASALATAEAGITALNGRVKSGILAGETLNFDISNNDIWLVVTAAGAAQMNAHIIWVYANNTQKIEICHAGSNNAGIITNTMKPQFAINATNLTALYAVVKLS